MLVNGATIVGSKLMGKFIRNWTRGKIDRTPGYCARSFRQTTGIGAPYARDIGQELFRSGKFARIDPRYMQPGDVGVWTEAANGQGHVAFFAVRDGKPGWIGNNEGELWKPITWNKGAPWNFYVYRQIR